MDDKYIEHLGMSQHVDEGLWDRLKSRASAFSQGAKNISGGKLGAVGTTETAKFNSLFRNFVAAELSIIKSLDKSLIPWAQYATPEEAQEIKQIEAFETALKNIDFGKLPVTEAFPTFSNIGARISGGVTPILNSYKQRLISTYENFINDVRKMNIVPDQYITRKIASSNSGAKEALDALGAIMNKPLVSPSMPAPAPTPAAPEAPAPTPEPAAPTPVAPAPAPTATEPSPTAEPEKPAEADVIPPEGKVIPASLPDRQQMDLAIYRLGKNTIRRIIENMSEKSRMTEAEDDTSADEKEDENLPMTDIIKKYWVRNAMKAVHPFKKDSKNFYVVYEKTGVFTSWDMRWRFVKEIHGHSVDILSIDKNSKGTVINESNWIPFIQWNAHDVINDEGYPLANADIMQLIKRTNVIFYNAIKNGESITKTPFLDPTQSKKLIESMYTISLVLAREPDRGKKQLGGADIPPEELGATKASAVLNPPDKPKAMGDLTKPDPTQQGRNKGTVEKEPEPPKSTDAGGKKTEPEKPKEPEKGPEKAPEEPSTKLFDLVPKSAKSAAKKPTVSKSKTPKAAKPEAPKKAPAASPAVAAPKPTAASAKPSAVAPAKPAEKPADPKLAAPKSTAPLGGDEYLVKFNKKYIEPHGLAPLKNREELKKFNDAIGVTGGGDIPDWKIPGAHAIAMGTPQTPKPAAPAAPAAKPKKKIKEGFEYRDFFSL